MVATTTDAGVRIVVMEIEGDMKSMTTMLKELTLDPSVPTVAVLGSKDGGGKLLIGITENTIASERYNAVELLRSISTHIRGWRRTPHVCARRWSHADGLGDALDAARQQLGLMIQQTSERLTVKYDTA